MKHAFLTGLLGLAGAIIGCSSPSGQETLVPEASDVLYPQAIIDRLDVEQDPSARQALILRLGDLPREAFREHELDTLVVRLLRWYRDDPDPGIHSAIDWLLRHGRQGMRERTLNWRQGLVLDQIDRELAGRPPDHRDWYVTTQGQTMVIVHGPVEFQMGSPDEEPGRTPDEVLHRVAIPRSFAIASKEVTVDQFQRFLEANPSIMRRHAYEDNPTRMAEILQKFSPDPDGPQIAVTWYEAAMYCNWLSKEDGIPESEWVYPPDFDTIKDGMELAGDYLHRVGYRLPTEAEWEYTARAGSTTARFFGDSEGLLDEYAWYSKNPPQRKGDPVDPADPQRTWPVGQLKPNAWGLFDVYGNVWEWGQDRRQEYRSSHDRREDRGDAVLIVTDEEARTRRGGSFAYGADVMRSAHRGATNYFPMQRRDNVGFRVARTISP